MNQPWYAHLEDDYIGSSAERTNFQQWYDDRYAEGRINPDYSEADLLDDYRDTQSWTDSFLDWAWVEEADKHIEQHTEENQ